MKKFLSLLAALTLTGSAALTVVSCADSENTPPYRNKDYFPEDLHQSEAEKLAINEAVIARLKAAILTDIYQINKQQTRDVAFRAFSGQEKNLQKTFANHFDEENFLASATKNQVLAINLNGNRGYNGGMLDYILNDLRLNGLVNFLKTFLNIDLASQQTKDKIYQLLGTGRDVLQVFTGEHLAKNLPGYFKKIPSDLLNKLPDDHDPNGIRSLLPASVQTLINAFLPTKQLDIVLDGLAKGTDLSAYKDFTLAQIGDAIVVNFVNFYGYGTNPEFQPFDPLTLGQSGDLNRVSAYLYEHHNDLEKFDLKPKMEVGLESLLKFISLFNCAMTVYKTPTVQPKDDQHLFNESQDNETFVAEIQTKVLSSFNLDLTHFNLGTLVDNFVYFFGQPKAENQRIAMAKFGYLLTYHGVISKTNPLPSFWKLVFGMVQANPATKSTGEQLNQMYQETFGPQMLKPIFANQGWKLADIKDKTINPTLWKAIDEAPKPTADGVIKTLDLGASLFAKNPLDALMTGNLRPLFESFETFFNATDYLRMKEDLQLLFGQTEPINAKNLLSIKLGSILGWAKIQPFAVNQFGLVPDYAGYYTNRSLRELVMEAGLTFKTAELDDLKYYYVDFNRLHKLFIQLFHDNQLHQDPNQGFIADFVQAYLEHDDFNNLIGYQPDDYNLVRRDSVLGTLLELLVPPISEQTGEIINIKETFDQDIVNRNDYASRFFDAIMSVLLNSFKPTPYTDFLTKAIRVDQAFSLHQELVYHGDGDIKGGTYTLTFNDEILAKALGYQPITKQIYNYTLTFNREKQAENYRFTKFIKREKTVKI